MNKFIATILFSLLGSVCFSQTVRFNDPDIYLSLEKPKNWNSYQRYGGFFFSPGEAETLPSIRFKYSITHEPPNTDSHIKFMCEMYLPNERENFELLKVSIDSLDQIQIQSYTFKQAMLSDKVISKLITFWAAGRQFELELTTTIDEFSIHEEAQSKILRSIRFERKED